MMYRLTFSSAASAIPIFKQSVTSGAALTTRPVHALARSTVSAAFGRDEIGQCGDSVTINSGDQAGILFVAVQALIKDRDKLAAENLELRTRLEKPENNLSRLDPK